jgi:hypothetical protein
VVARVAVAKAAEAIPGAGAGSQQHQSDRGGGSRSSESILWVNGNLQVALAHCSGFVAVLSLIDPNSSHIRQALRARNVLLEQAGACWSEAHQWLMSPMVSTQRSRTGWAAITGSFQRPSIGELSSPERESDGTEPTDASSGRSGHSVCDSIAGGAGAVVVRIQPGNDFGIPLIVAGDTYYSFAKSGQL